MKIRNVARLETTGMQENVFYGKRSLIMVFFGNYFEKEKAQVFTLEPTGRLCLDYPGNKDTLVLKNGISENELFQLAKEGFEKFKTAFEKLDLPPDVLL